MSTQVKNDEKITDAFGAMGNPSAEMMTKLNRFQTILNGQNQNNKKAGARFGPDVLKMIPNKITKEDGFNVAKVLPGPMWKTNHEFEKVVEQIGIGAVTGRSGTNHIRWMKIQDEIAKDDSVLAQDKRSINFVIPRVMISDSELPFLCNCVIVCNPEDCARLAKNHVIKQPNFTPILFQSLIATTDADHWKKQRNHLADVFLPIKSLKNIFNVSRDRAEKCADIMGELMSKQGKYGVQVHEFFLHEAQAQLQMALFGLDEDYMEKTNKKIRDGFAGINPDVNYLRDVTLEMMRKVGENPNYATASDPEVIRGEKDIFGPISKAVYNASKELDLNLPDQFGNMMLILFAGHDTTAHTMTWFSYEMARNPDIQQRIHQECDRFFKELNGRKMVYEDCEKLPFLTKCVMETLRLWPAVANGTFRELQYDDFVIGPNGKEVMLPKGTYVQVQSILRHRSEKLWGPDALKFNPDRDWGEDEIWDNGHFRGYNPSSKRFSPFTYAPRDCLGKNFAQMEMRTILANVFYRYHFTLSEPYAKFDEKTAGFPLENLQATVGPRDITPEGLEATKRRFDNGQTPQMAMYLKVNARQPSSSL